jgi:hypothetical protein
MKNFKTYQLIINSSRNQQEGSVLVITVVISAFMFALLAMYMVFAENIQKFSQADTRLFNTLKASSGALADRSDLVVAALQTDPNSLKSTVLQSSTPFDCLRGTSINTAKSACNTFKPQSSQIDNRFGLSSVESNTVADEYQGYTTVTDNTNYADYASGQVNWDRLSTADVFGGALSRSYRYTVGSLGVKQDGNGNTRSQSILQSNVIARNIPVFQFDRFSFGADTIVIRDTGVPQTLSGRYHSNGDLTLINNNSAAAILAGKWTTGGKLNSTNGSTYLTLAGGFSPLPNLSPVPFADIYNYSSMLRSADMGMRSLIVPNPELLKPKDSGGNLQSLYGNADIRLHRRMTARDGAVPFDLVAIQSGGSAKGGACVDLSPDRKNIATTKCQRFSKGMLVSLQQPILVKNNGSATEEAKYCKNQPAPDPTIATYSPAIQDKILRAVEIVLSTNQVNTFNLSVLGTLSLDDIIYRSSSKVYDDALYLTDAKAHLSTLLGSIVGVNASDIPALSKANAQALAAARQNCFLAPAIQIPTASVDIRKTTQAAQSPLFLDGREHKLLNLFQVNVQSLAVWNRDGIYVEFPSEDLDVLEAVPLAQLLTLLGNSSTTDGYLWPRLPSDLAKPGTLAESGLGAESLIIHNSAEDLALSSVVYTNGANLPSPMSIVTERPLYVQGNWNSINKQPSSLMGDVLTLLSENCLSKVDNFRNSFGYLIPKGQPNCGVTSGGMSLAEDTTVNAAILSGVNPITGTNVDSSPIRYLEDWTNRILYLKTSFAINGAPVSNSSFVAPNKTGPYAWNEYFRYPITNISFDASFAEPDGLPPGTPMAIDIMRDGIERKSKEGQKENIQKNFF